MSLVQFHFQLKIHFKLLKNLTKTNSYVGYMEVLTFDKGLYNLNLFHKEEKFDLQDFEKLPNTL